MDSTLKLDNEHRIPTKTHQQYKALSLSDYSKTSNNTLILKMADQHIDLSLCVKNNYVFFVKTQIVLEK
jgi:hypothetical protein